MAREREGLARKHLEEKKELEDMLNDASVDALEERDRLKAVTGDSDLELKASVEREAEWANKYAALKEGSVKTSVEAEARDAEVSDLRNAKASYSSRAELSAKRELQAEEREEEARRLHAKYKRDAQRRESDLEGKLSELTTNLSSCQRELETVKRGEGGEAMIGGSNEEALHSANVTIHSLTMQLEVEKQNCGNIQTELRVLQAESISSESVNREENEQLKRRVNEISGSCVRLEQEAKNEKAWRNKAVADLEDVKKGGGGEVVRNEFEANLKALTDQVLKQQVKLDSAFSEKSALNARLRVALTRERDLKAKLMEAEAEAAADDDYLFDGSGSGNGSGVHGLDGGGRGGGVYTPVRGVGEGVRKRGGRQVVSISKAINFGDSGRTPGKEKIAKVIDELDMWSINTGVFLKRNPLARAALLLYLLVLHVWVIGILIFHAHNFEVVHGDFGSYRHMDNLHGHPEGWLEGVEVGGGEGEGDIVT
jgi:hypothetical protein